MPKCYQSFLRVDQIVAVSSIFVSVVLVAGIGFDDGMESELKCLNYAVTVGWPGLGWAGLGWAGLRPPGNLKMELRKKTSTSKYQKLRLDALL